MSDDRYTGDEGADQDLAFFNMWSKHHSVVFAYILTLVNDPDDAEDILQDTASICWQKRDRYDGTSLFTTWACGVARLEALRFLRSQRKAGLGFSEETLNQIADRLEARLKAEPTFVEDRRRALHECLEQLSNQQRQLLQTRYVQGVPTATLAQRLGLTLDSVYSKLKRIRARLVACVDNKLKKNHYPDLEHPDHGSA